MDGFMDVVGNDRFIPHGYCFLWRPELVWMHVLSDLVIAVSYFAIPIIIVTIMRRRKKALPYNWVFGMFATFIFFCGLTHIIELIGVWQPYYYFEGVVKVMTAAVSLATAIIVLPLIPILIDRFERMERGEKNTAKGESASEADKK